MNDKETQDYQVKVFYSEEDHGFIANVSDLKFCSAFGNTPEQALYEVELAKQAWLDVARKVGLK
jgi:predicted RNase H-like HicB family nuclease